MTLSRLALASLLLAPLAVAQDKGPAKAPEKAPELTPETAVKAAEAYVALIKEKKADKALEKHWSFERLCAGIFKADFEKLSAEDKAACAKGIHDLLLPGMSDPEVADLMAAATYEKYEAKPPADGKVEVGFVVTLHLEGQPPEPTKQFVWVEKVGSELRIVDMARGAADERLTALIGAQWAQAKQDTPKLTPLAYVKLMAQGQ